MSRIFVCRHNHHWDADAIHPKPGTSRETCPQCGYPGMRQMRTAAGAVPPPPPLPTRTVTAAKPVTVPAAALEPTVSLADPFASSIPTRPAEIKPVDTNPVWAKVDLAPSLPMTVFVSSDRFQEQRMGALAIYCSDGRFGEAFDEFCHRSLQIPRYDRFAIPGGPGWICQCTANPDSAVAAKAQLEYLVTGHKIDRIVLITHFACAYYREKTHKEPDAALPDQFADVKAAAALLRGWFKDVKVEGYLAMRSGAMISFHRLEVG